MNLIDRDELRRRLLDDTYLDDAGFPLSPDAPILDASERVIQSLMLSVLAILDAMPSPTCATCGHADLTVLQSELPDCVHCDLLHSAWRCIDGCSHWQPREEKA